MRDVVPGEFAAAEPLVRMDDLAEYRRGLDRYLAGEWDDERWTAYRVRFGVYGQKQPGVQMVRIKIPGGRLPVAWLRTLAAVNRQFAVGDAHVTTRQDIQIYHVPLARTADLLETLYSQGITTREACGNTLRNMTACALAGTCPRELVDAGKVADNLARAWIRHPLVQHMPRKVKITVSGCATDCGHTAIHDLGFVAVERDGARGFRVMAGGGLGAQPRAAIEVLPFVSEHDLGAVVETLARLHQRYSDRRNRNAARIKFVVKRFGDDTFRALFAEEFERVRALPQRPWEPVQWRDGADAVVARSPAGVLDGHDGSKAVVAAVPLGILSSDQLARLADIAEDAGIAELRATREQDLVLPGVAPERVAAVVAALKGIGFDVPASAADIPEVISCPGTTTCRIGITNSQSFARRVFEDALADPLAKGTSVHVSGCQNSCGLHHVADFGLHGMAKKLDGRSAPHYQLHLGGDAGTGQIALSGPLIPARQADQALVLLRRAYAHHRLAGEGVRGWAERVGKDGIDAVLAPLAGQEPDGLFVDWGDASDFPGAPQARGECAAPFAADDLYADLADDGLITLDRSLAVGDRAAALEAGDRAVVYAARRLLHFRAVPSEDGQTLEALEAAVRGAFPGDAEPPVVLHTVRTARSGSLSAYREAVAYLLDTVRAVIEAPAAPAVAAVGDINALLGAAE